MQTFRAFANQSGTGKDGLPEGIHKIDKSKLKQYEERESQFDQRTSTMSVKQPKKIKFSSFLNNEKEYTLQPDLTP